MIDRPGRPVPRFPPDLEDRVRVELGRALIPWNSDAAMSASAGRLAAATFSSLAKRLTGASAWRSSLPIPRSTTWSSRFPSLARIGAPVYRVHHTSGLLPGLTRNLLGPNRTARH
jgi:hypothetical protein